MGTHMGEIAEMTRGYRYLTQGVLGNRINFIFLILATIVVFFMNNSYEKSNKNIRSEKIMYILLSILLLNTTSDFLYFNF